MMVKNSIDKQMPKRWSAKRKMEVVLRLLQGESVDELSRELGVEMYRIAKWKDEALFGLENGLKERNADLRDVELARAKQQIGELSMEIELLRERVKKQGPLVLRRSK
jgi:transposase